MHDTNALLKKNSDAAFMKLGEVKKFNYLLGMSMWMLTKEKKDELLKQRDLRLAELTALR